MMESGYFNYGNFREYCYFAGGGEFCSIETGIPSGHGLTKLLYNGIIVSLDLSTKVSLIIPSILFAFLTALLHTLLLPL